MADIQPPDYATGPLAGYAQGLNSAAAIQTIGHNAQVDAQAATDAATAEATRKAAQADLAALANNPHPQPQDFVKLMIKYPALSENLKRAADTNDSATVASDINELLPIYAASLSDPELAATQMEKIATGHRNAGDEQTAKRGEAMASVMREHPGTARASIGMVLANKMGADKFTATLAGLSAPAAEQKAQAEADTASAKAAAAPDQEQLANQTAAEAIQSSQLKRKLDVLDTQIKQATTETARGTLQVERDKLALEYQKLTDKQGQPADAAQGAMDTLTTSLGTVKDLLAHPGLSKGTGMGGDFMAWFNGSDAANFRSQLGVLKSEQFLTALDSLKQTGRNGASGLGALSNAEGLRLERAQASLDTVQSAAQMRTQLGIIFHLMNKAQATLIARGKIPMTGGAPVIKHEKYGVVKEGDVNRLMQQNPGYTRDQILQFLQGSAPVSAAGG